MIEQNISLERVPAAIRSGAPRGIWVGDDTAPEMALAFRWASQQLAVVQEAGVPEALQVVGPPPAVVFVPFTWSGEVAGGDLVKLARRWPLAVLVLVVGSVVDGWRRRGPVLPAAVAVPWYELPGRLWLWNQQREAGLAGGLGTPTTSRREDRLLARLAADRRCRQPVLQAAVAAPSQSLGEGLELLAVTAGIRVVSRCQGSPDAHAEGDVVLWDVGDVGEAQREHLRLLRAAQPTRPVLLLESFPRGDTAVEVLACGGSHLLGRPLEADVLSATIRWCWQPHLPLG